MPANLKVVLGSNTLANLTHSYDANGNVTFIDDAVNGSSFDRSMGYDDLDRLETASGFWGAGSYSFDALGNIRTKTESGIDLDYSYSAGTNRLASIDDSVGSADYSFSYDSYGNVTNNGSQGFAYNLAGQMTSSTNPGVSYRYDGHKRRVQKTEGGQTGYTVYGASGRLMHKRKGGVSTHYLYAGSLLIAEKQGSNLHYVHTDLLGSPIKGDDGTSYSEHYRPWGEKKDHPTQLADDVGYTGHQSDVATGLTYMQARYYDSVVGRFMGVDPVEFVAHNPMSFNRYLYVNNNPYRFKDPDGKFLIGAFVGAALGGIFEAGRQYMAGEAINPTKIAIAAGAGALAGLGGGVIAGQIARVSGQVAGSTGTGLNTASRVLLSASGNAGVGAVTSAGHQVANNNVDGAPLSTGVVEAAGNGWIAGAAGGAFGEAVGAGAELSGPMKVVIEGAAVSVNKGTSEALDAFGEYLEDNVNEK